MVESRRSVSANSDVSKAVVKFKRIETKVFRVKSEVETNERPCRRTIEHASGFNKFFTPKEIQVRTIDCQSAHDSSNNGTNRSNKKSETVTLNQKFSATVKTPFEKVKNLKTRNRGKINAVHGFTTENLVPVNYKSEGINS